MQIAPAPLKRTGLSRFYAALLARSWLAAALLLVLTALAAWHATRVQVAVNLSGLIGPQTEGARAIRDYEQRFQPWRDEDVLLVTTDSFATEAALTALEDLVLELQFAEGVEQVISLAGLPAPGRTGAWLSGPELAPLPPAARLRTMRAQSPLAVQLISADLSATVLVVIPQAGVGSEALSAAVAQAIASVSAAGSGFAGPGLAVHSVGIGAVQRAIASELIHDLQVLIPAAVALCLLVSLLLFRNWRAVVVIALPPIVGLVWFLGWMGATRTAIDPVMGALPVLLIVLAFSDAIHVYHAAINALRAGGARRVALVRALVETAPAAALTSLTTIIAFASLSLPASPSLNTMAYAGVAGMVLSLAAVLLATPVLMLVLGVPRAGGQVPRLFAVVVPAARAVARRGRVVALVTVLVLGTFWALQSRATIGFRYADYLPRGGEISAALVQMEDSGLGSDRMLVIVQGDPADPLARVRRAVTAIWGEERAGWSAGDSGAMMLAQMASVDGLAHALPVQLPISARDVRADTALSVLRGQLAAAGLEAHTRIVGPGYALLTEGPRLIESLRLGLYGTISAVTLLVALAYRSWRLALVALVVNLIPILGVEAWLVLLGRELTIMNVIALTIAFGIAVDDTLHFLNRFRLAPPGPVSTRVRCALTEAGPAMTATTVILLAGLVVTLTSALPGLAVYGGLIGLAVILALLADLFLLPGLIRWSLR